MNDCFQANSRKINHRIRGSNYELQVIQPLGCRYYLIEMKPKTMSLKDIYEIAIDEEGVDQDFWIENSGYSLPNYLFSSYMQRILQSPNRYAVFRKQFTAQWALMYVFCILFKVSLADIQLSKVWICLKSGVISFGMFNVEMMDVDAGEFRLTPNIFEIIGNAGVYGYMPTVIMNAFSALNNELPQIYNMIKLILDDKKIDYESILTTVRQNSEYDKISKLLTDSMSLCTNSHGWIPWF